MKLSIAHSKTDHEAAGQIVGMIASGNPDLPRGGVADMAGGRRHHPWRGVPQPSIVTESPPTCPTEAAGRDPGRHGVGGTGGVEHKFRYRHGVSPEILVRSQIKGSVPHRLHSRAIDCHGDRSSHPRADHDSACSPFLTDRQTVRSPPFTDRWGDDGRSICSP